MSQKIWVLSLFPQSFEFFLRDGVVGSALSKKNYVVEVVNVRDYGLGNYHSVDDYPYGGGPGMLMRPDVLETAFLKGVVEKGGYGENFKEKLHVVFPSPQGSVWNNDYCQKFSQTYLSVNSTKELVFIAGRYEGIDQRFLDQYVDEEISLGDFVLSGGELAIMCLLDSALRFSESTLGNSASAHQDSFENGLLEFPQYTRPSEFNEAQIPEVLLSGHHLNIAKWRLEKQIEVTKKKRPDLYRAYVSKGKK